MSSAFTLWWLALPVLLLPIWWHRQRREHSRAILLATARFLPSSDPQQQRVWQWVDHFLLMLRCLLLLLAIAWLADLALPWRADSVLIAPGSEPAWAEQQIRDAGFADAARIALPSTDAFGWLRIHQREWRSKARWLVLGAVPMPAGLPQWQHSIQLRSPPVAGSPPTQHIAIVSQHPEPWKAFFSALAAPQRFVLDSALTGSANLVIWDQSFAPPAALHAPLWWVTDPSVFPELAKAGQVDGLRYADSPHGRLWTSAAWPPSDAAAARRLFEQWQQLHLAPPPFLTPTMQFEPAPPAPAPVAPSGALFDVLGWVLLALFALERSVAHARRG
jgi:hypothetical protein